MRPDATAEGSAALSEQEAALVRKSSRMIAGFARDGERLRVTLTRENGERAETTVPGRALQMVAQVLDEISTRGTSALVPLGPELTTHQAAALMRVSRPYLIKLLDTGKLPHRRVGTHRRILRADVVAYIDRERAARCDALDEMTAEAQRLGLYE